MSVRRSETRIEIRYSHLEHRRTFELHERLDQVLRVVVGHAGEAILEIGGQLRPARHIDQRAIVEQLIEQQRVCGQLLDEKVPAATHGQKAGPSDWVFVEQCEV